MYLLAAFDMTWDKLGGSSFIELTTGVNLAFVAWDKFQERLKFVERECGEIVNQSCASIIDAEQRGNLEQHLQGILRKVDSSFRVLWKRAHRFGLCCVVAGFVMLYADWQCPWNCLLLLPILIYLSVSFLIGRHFRKVCAGHCATIEIVNGSKPKDGSKQAANIVKTIESDVTPHVADIPPPASSSTSKDYRPPPKPSQSIPATRRDYPAKKKKR